MLFKINRFKNLQTFSTVKPDITAFHQSQSSTLSHPLIKVSKDDVCIGEVSKIDAHLNSMSIPHRAFSLFVFDKDYRLLLQQRASVKITFPNYWTNTCCSHPLNIKGEKEEYWCMGVKKAASRRLKFEIGLKIFTLQGIFPVNKIYYKAIYDDTWGENEVDYVLFTKLPGGRKAIDEIKFNKDEVKAIEWVGREQVKEFLKEKEAKGEKTTPWMKLMLDYKLLEWWEAYEKNHLKTDLKQVIDLSV